MRNQGLRFNFFSELLHPQNHFYQFYPNVLGIVLGIEVIRLDTAVPGKLELADSICSLYPGLLLWKAN